MEKLIRFSFMIFVLSSTLTQKALADTTFGICTYGKETVSQVICYGPAVLRDTTISGDLKVAGPVKASKIKVNAMIIAGSTDIQDSKVSGLVEVTGHLTAKNVEFAKNLKIEANEVILDHVTAKNSIFIHSIATKSYLIMQCGTTVAGSVTFDGEQGVVQVTDDSIVQGKIINGTLEFVKKDCEKAPAPLATPAPSPPQGT